MNVPVFDLHCDTSLALLGESLRECGSLKTNNYHIDLDHHNAGSDSHACGELLLNMIEEGADINQFIKTYYF